MVYAKHLPCNAKILDSALKHTRHWTLGSGKQDDTNTDGLYRIHGALKTPKLQLECNPTSPIVEDRSPSSPFSFPFQVGEVCFGGPSLACLNTFCSARNSERKYKAMHTERTWHPAM